MKKKNLHKFLRSFASGSPTREDKELVEAFFDLVQQELPDEQLNAVQQRHIQDKIFTNIQQRTQTTNQTQKDKNINWWVKVAKWSVAASILLLVGWIAWMQLSTSGMQDDRRIVSSDFGERKMIVLPDGSKVILKGKSSLSYPATFDGDNRKVTLDGVAFFEIKKNKNQTFQIQSAHAITEVLGTTFFINDQAERTQVTVLSGKVKVSSTEEDDSMIILTKAEQATLDRTRGVLYKKKINVAWYEEWKNGKLLLDSSSIENTAKKLAFWYDIRVTVSQTSVSQTECFISGTYQNESLINVLESISFATGLKYEFVNPNHVRLITGCK